MRLQAAFRIPSEKLLNSWSYRFGKFLDMRAENYADKRVILDEHEVRRRRRDAPASEANNEEAPLPVHYAGALVKNIATHWLEDDIEARFTS